MGKLYYIFVFKKNHVKSGYKALSEVNEKSGVSFCCGGSQDCMWAWGLLPSGSGMQRPLVINWHSFSLSCCPLCSGNLSVLGSAAVGHWNDFISLLPSAGSRLSSRELCCFFQALVLSLVSAGITQAQLAGSMSLLNTAFIASSQNEGI